MAPAHPSDPGSLWEEIQKELEAIDQETERKEQEKKEYLAKEKERLIKKREASEARKKQDEEIDKLLDDDQEKWEEIQREEARKVRESQERENEKDKASSELRKAAEMLDEYKKSVLNRSQDGIEYATDLQNAIKVIHEATNSNDPTMLPKGILDLGAGFLNPGSVIDWANDEYIDKGLETVTKLVGPLEENYDGTWDRVFEEVESTKRRTKTVEQFQRQIMGKDFRKSVKQYLGEIERRHGAEAASEMSRSLFKDSVNMLHGLKKLDDMLLIGNATR
jgi:DNA repair exonuclease SbcCD ATPase subunit